MVQVPVKELERKVFAVHKTNYWTYSTVATCETGLQRWHKPEVLAIN
jgi:hypothetical protein